MSESYHIEKLESPAWKIIGQGITDFNTQQAGDDQAKNICFVLKDHEGEVVGGVIGTTYWEWLSIELMWLREDLRGQGYGHQLLALAEDEGRRRGATHAHLDTFSFQAPGFYQKYGYQIFGELHDFPAGHMRYYLTKDL